MTRHKDNTCQVEGCKNQCWKDVCNGCSRRIRYGSLPEQLGIRRNPSCTVKGCEEPRYTSKGLYCRGHYDTSLTGKNPKSKAPKRKNHSTPPDCGELGCSLPAQAKGKCAKHRARELNPPKKTKCVVDGCDLRTLHDRCAKHKKQFEKFGVAWEGRRPTALIREIRERSYGTCTILGCDRAETSLGKGVCKTHLADRSRKGCSDDFYAELMSRDSCESCGVGGKLVVDHDHSCHTGDKMCESCIRGRLCNGCNTALGYAGESASRLRMLADYIERFN